MDMGNPYELPLLVIGLLTGAIAGLIPGRTYTAWLNRLYILGLGACVSWFLQTHLVDWAYTHPFNPNDGAPRVMAALGGWLVALTWPILPVFASVLAVRWVFARLSKRRSYAA
jgi:hypothetical protein